MKKQITKILYILLTQCLLMSLTACGGLSNGSGAVEADSGMTENDFSTIKSGSAVQSKNTENVKAAMDAADRLSTGSYFLLADGSILTRKESLLNFAVDYAALSGVKKIVDSCSEMELFVLTENGELYYRDIKIMDGVIDAVYGTTNVNQKLTAITEDEIYWLYEDDSVNESVRANNPDDYTDVGDRVITHSQKMPSIYMDLSAADGSYAQAPFAAVSAEKSDYFILTADGKVFTDGNDYFGMSFFAWENIVVFDAQKRMLTSSDDDERETEITVAAILADGTVVAEGVYADDILAWGPLDYITMSDSIIIGLMPDGKLKATGVAAEYIEPDIADWQNIVAVKVGGTSTAERVINAMDTDGNCYQLRYDSQGTDTYVDIVSPSDGLIKGDSRFFKYSPDGTVYCTDGNNNTWEHYED